MGLNIGDKAPEILGVNEKGEEIRLSNYRGKKIVILLFIQKIILPDVQRRLVACVTIIQNCVKPVTK